jgi:hypothetical protein
MKHAIWAVVVVAVLAGLVLMLWPQRGDVPSAPDTAVTLPPPATLPEPEEEPPWYEQPAEPPPAFVEEVAPDAPPAPPLPPLDSSDEAVAAALGELAGAGFVERWVVTESLVRRAVTTVDNLPRAHVSQNVRVLTSVDGRFKVRGSDDALYLDPAGYQRYKPLVDLVASLDPVESVAFYERFYPLAQQAYEELGYPSRQFHNRLIEVIDHLLGTPQVQGPVKLVRPHVLYQFADPRLEALSFGQKVLIRMGPENARVVKTALRALRDELATRSEISG